MTLAALPESQTAKYPAIRNFVAGQFTSSSSPLLAVLNPSDGTLLSRVPLSTAVQLDGAVRSAAKALPGWSGTPIKERVQILFRYRALLERHFDELAALINEEHGKVL